MRGWPSRLTSKLVVMPVMAPALTREAAQPMPRCVKATAKGALRSIVSYGTMPVMTAHMAA